MLLALCSPALKSYARACDLMSSDPVRFREIALSVTVHSVLAAAFAAAALVAERRFGKPFGWSFAALGTSAVFVVLALEIVQHALAGGGALGAVAWLFGMLLGIPVAVVAAALTTWWMVGVAGVSVSKWCVACAVVYVPLIVSHGFSHF